MSSTKLEKVKAELAKTKDKIVRLQSRQRELERQKTALENTQIVALVRSERISDDDLAALMESIRKDKPTQESEDDASCA